MSYEWLVIISVAKFTGAFLLFYVYLPTKLFSQNRQTSSIERFFENLTFMVFCTLVFVQILSILRIYSLASLIVCYLALYAAKRCRQEGVASFVTELRESIPRLNVRILEALDGLTDLRATFKQRLREKIQLLLEYVSTGANGLHLTLVSLVLLPAIFLRLADVFDYAGPGFSDNYFHLVATKTLEIGQPYSEGLYPKGFHAFMSVIHLSTGTDLVLVMRLLGPLIGVLIALSVYYTICHLTRNRAAALIGMLLIGVLDGQSSALFEILGIEYWNAAFGTTPAAPFMYNLYRQTAGLPNEFAMVFFLPALLFGDACLSGATNRRSRALLFAAVVIICMTNWVVMAALVVGLTVVGTVSLVVVRPAFEALRKCTGTALLAGLVGNYQLLVFVFGAKLLRTESQQALYLSNLPGRYTDWLQLWQEPLPISPILYVSAGIAGVFCLFGLVSEKEKSRKSLWVALGLLGLVLLLEIRSVNWGVNYILPPDRTGQYLTLVLAVAIGGIWSKITGFRSRLAGSSRYLVFHQTAAAVVGFAITVVAWPSSLPEPHKYEYSSLARLYHQISREYPPLEWTIVSNVEDYSKALKRGWHMNVSEFLADLDPRDPAIPIPTPYVFLFVEKKPLQVVTTYQDAFTRHDEQRRFAEWAFIHNALHNDLILYYEDETVLVYLLKPEQTAGLSRRPGGMK